MPIMHLKTIFFERIFKSYQIEFKLFCSDVNMWLIYENMQTQYSNSFNGYKTSLKDCEMSDSEFEPEDLTVFLFINITFSSKGHKESAENSHSN